MLEERLRKLTESERRLLGARARELDQTVQGRSDRMTLVCGLIFGFLWAVTNIVSDASPLVVAAFWIVVGLAITVWVRRGVAAELATFRAMRGGIESALRADQARVVDIKATGFVAFEEVEDEGAGYAFDLADGRVFFLVGQQYDRSAKFPCLHFSVVHALDEDQRVVDEWIEKRTKRAVPDRIIPAEAKLQLELPENQATINGSLDQLEKLLGVGRRA